jgi:hypothetical protein
MGTRVLATGSGHVTVNNMVKDARELLLGFLDKIGWLDAGIADDLRAAHAPKTDSIRDLMKAKLLLASKSDSDEARDLYEQAMKDDPALANLFDELKTEFSDITSTLGVMSFVNASANPQDEWMVEGVSLALAADLPKMNFTVVERSQIRELIERSARAQMLDPNACWTRTPRWRLANASRPISWSWAALCTCNPIFALMPVLWRSGPESSCSRRLRKTETTTSWKLCSCCVRISSRASIRICRQRFSQSCRAR